MNMFKIMQHRGCGIEYEVFFGTFEECQKEMHALTGMVSTQMGEHYVSSNDEDINGDGLLFDYSIEEES